MKFTEHQRQLAHRAIDLALEEIEVEASKREALLVAPARINFEVLVEVARPNGERMRILSKPIAELA